MFIEENPPRPTSGTKLHPQSYIVEWKDQPPKPGDRFLIHNSAFWWRSRCLPYSRPASYLSNGQISDSRRNVHLSDNGWHGQKGKGSEVGRLEHADTRNWKRSYPASRRHMSKRAASITACQTLVAPSYEILVLPLDRLRLCTLVTCAGKLDGSSPAVQSRVATSRLRMPHPGKRFRLRRGCGK
jgi:hypothetical protein